MKPFNFSCKAICAVLVIILIASSCSSAKKTAISCPALPGYHNAQKVTLHHNRHKQHLFSSSDRYLRHQSSFINHSGSSKKEHGKYLKVQKDTNFSSGRTVSALPEDFSKLNRNEFKDILLASADNSIIPALKISSENNENASSQGDTEPGRINAKTTTAGYLASASVISSKDKYIADKISEKKTEKTVNSQDQPVKIHTLAIVGLIVGLVGLFVAGIPLGVIAMIFGFVALNKIKKNPGAFRGRGLSIASIILGIIDIIGAIIVLSM